MRIICCLKKRSYVYFSEFFGEHYFKFIVCVAHTFMFLVTITMSWTSPALPKLSETKDNPLKNPITPDESDLIGSLLYIGAAIGPILFIPAAEHFGRKNVLQFLAFIPLFTYGTFLFAREVMLYFVCRVLQGVFVGGTMSVQAVYVAEILAEEDRDFYMSLLTPFGFSGLIIVYAVAPFVSLIYFNGFLTVLSAFLVVLLCFGCPDTPYDVMKTRGTDSTKELLMLLRKNFKNREVDDIKKTIETEVRGSYFDLFSSLRSLKTLTQATVPLLLQQFSGITVLLTYSQLIFEKTDITIEPAVCSLIVACFQVLTSFFTPVLIKSGKFSLKVLLLFCLSGMAFSNLILTSYFLFWKDVASLNWLPLLGLVSFVPFYSCGIDPIPWMQLGQIFPKNLSSVGAALSASMFYLSSFPALFLFSKIDIGFLFLSSTCFCCLGIPYVLFCFFEPKSV